MKILLNQTIPFRHANGFSNIGKTLHQRLTFDVNTSSNTSVSSTLIKQSPSPTTAPDWFIAFHSRSHFKNPFRVFDQTFELVFEMVHIVSSAEIRNMSELHLS